MYILHKKLIHYEDKIFYCSFIFFITCNSISSIIFCRLLGFINMKLQEKKKREILCLDILTVVIFQLLAESII